ncbi:dihydrofolate reductase family protein [Lampropedia aestuarii]|uniref:dihydrofolate reductase family protein n=1 Tax=Lampropedia aestuarii TaxID=2562762 RepID=UPI002468E1C4|nr:dihydrofolate reductase family protein [Lampropedia aestuarii]MDH5858176.1 dihydrofolate reductase family protein [Lampropedia aestuarii]
MSIECSVYIATSVDGFIAQLDGGIDWLARPEYAASPIQGLSYEAFIATVDAIVMGKNTFNKVLTFDAWPYENIPVVVLSSAALDIPAQLQGKVQHANGTPASIAKQLANQGLRHLYIDGGVTIQRFLQAGLIDTLTITRIPVLLGSGIPLFNTAPSQQHLQLIEVHASDNGFVQERYRVERNTAMD